MAQSASSHEYSTCTSNTTFLVTQLLHSYVVMPQPIGATRGGYMYVCSSGMSSYSTEILWQVSNDACTVDAHVYVLCP